MQPQATALPEPLDAGQGRNRASLGLSEGQSAARASTPSLCRPELCEHFWVLGHHVRADWSQRLQESVTEEELPEQMRTLHDPSIPGPIDVGIKTKLKRRRLCVCKGAGAVHLEKGRWTEQGGRELPVSCRRGDLGRDVAFGGSVFVRMRCGPHPGFLESSCRSA